MVKWSIPAKHDLKEIHDFIAKDSKYYANNVSKNILIESKELKSFPKKGREVPEIDDPNIREIFIYSYRLIYQISDKNIEVLALIHGKRNFVPEMLNKEFPTNE